MIHWRDLDPGGCKESGLLSLMRRHRHHLTNEQYGRLSGYLAMHPAPRLLRAIAELKGAGLAPLVQLGNTLDAWRA